MYFSEWTRQMIILREQENYLRKKLWLMRYKSHDLLYILYILRVINYMNN